MLLAQEAIWLSVAEPLYHQYALRPQSELSQTQAKLSLELIDTCYRLSTDFLTYPGPSCLPSKNPVKNLVMNRQDWSLEHV